MTAQFRTPLRFQDDGGFPYTLTDPLIYDSAIANRTILVPAGFQTDLASIPRGLWNVLPKSGPYDKAAVIHDFLYRYNGCTRAQADGILGEAMQASGVSGWQRWTILLAVRIGGQGIWNKHRAEQPA